MAMKGVRYLVDDSGRKTAVILDLRQHGRLWEDLYDRMLVESRRAEARLSIDQVKAGLARKSRRTVKANG